MWALTRDGLPCCDLTFEGRWWIAVDQKDLLQEVQALLPVTVDATEFSDERMQEELLCRLLLNEVDGLVIWTIETGGAYQKIQMIPPLVGLHWQDPPLA